MPYYLLINNFYFFFNLKYGNIINWDSIMKILQKYKELPYAGYLDNFELDKRPLYEVYICLLKDKVIAIGFFGLNKNLELEFKTPEEVGKFRQMLIFNGYTLSPVTELDIKTLSFVKPFN